MSIFCGYKTHCKQTEILLSLETMKLTSKQIRLVIILILVAIIIGQAGWVYNMYNAYLIQLSEAKETALQNAILKEFSNRHEQMGGTIVYVPLTHHLDTARFITKTIRSADTSFQVTYDRHDPHSDKKLGQFLLKDIKPVNLKMLDSLFRNELELRGIQNIYTDLEYIDLQNDVIIQQTKSPNDKKVYDMATLKVIDIFETLAIKAYLNYPTYSIVRKMAIQLFLSTVLISICCFLFIIIIRTFFWREKLERIRKDSVNMMTHEFKRPISSVVALIALIPHYLGKGDKERIQQYVTKSLLELEKLLAYIQYVQKLSNNSAETIPLQCVHLNLQDLFSSVVEKYRTAKDNLVKLDLSLRTKQTTIYADLLHFANIIDNLIENAIKYSNERVHIEITVTDAQDKLKITVKDDGLGILDSDLPHIFTTFYRSNDKEIQRRVGLGLGLTYVKALVEAHGGEIKVKSKFGMGSEFIVYFP